MSKRYACYCMTRNIYHKVIPSLKSLLIHGKPDKVFLLTEDDDVGFDLPDRVVVVNVSGQTFFSQDGPNYNNGWTWMVLMRIALCHIFPDIDRIVSLDLDTIVDGDISDLWDTPMGNHYMAGVREINKSAENGIYVNGGVILWNLAEMRKGKANEIIRALNTTYYRFPEQDCMNALCRGNIYELNPAYNFSNYSARTPYPKIYHFAATGWWYETQPLMKKYKDIPWEEIK